MNRKNNLPHELNIDIKSDGGCTPLDIDIRAIKRNVGVRIDSAYTERKSYAMKSKKKISIIAIAATVVLGTGVLASNGIFSSWLSSSSSVPDYKSLPTQQQVEKDIGYSAVLIDTFENGYTFKDGSVVNNNLADEDDKSVEKFKSVSFDYEKDGDTVIFAQDKFNPGMQMQGSVAKTVNGADIYYYSYTNKSVPANYKLTDADKKAEESGELVFSYGSPDIEIIQVQSVSWVKDGVHYQLLQLDGKLSADELEQMAEEVMNK